MDAGSCGDGLLQPPEGCDDGNTASNDGCGATCQVEPGFSCTGAHPSVCINQSGAPFGAISFFSAPSCPPGWLPASETQGRLLVGADGAVGLQVGPALADQEDRKHVHAFATVVTLPSMNIAAADGPNLNGAASGEVPVTGVTGDGGSGLVFQQLLACRATQPSPGGDGYPSAALVAFADAGCPTGWDPCAEAVGRTLVNGSGPLNPVGAPLASGEQRTHTHAWIGRLTLGSTSFAGLAGGSNAGLTSAAALSVADETAPAWDGVPYLQVQYCQKRAAPNTAVLPTGLLTFFADGGCPPGWSAADAGSYLVGLPDGGLPGAVFGQAVQAHEVATLVSTNAHGIALASGCCAAGYGANGTYLMRGTTIDGGALFPRLELPLCQK